MERISALALLLFGCAMCAVSIALPPIGEIDTSVLMLFGQILVYAGSIFGVKIYIKDLIRKQTLNNAKQCQNTQTSPGDSD